MAIYTFLIVETFSMEPVTIALGLLSGKTLADAIFFTILIVAIFLIFKYPTEADKKHIEKRAEDRRAATHAKKLTAQEKLEVRAIVQDELTKIKPVD